MREIKLGKKAWISAESFTIREEYVEDKVTGKKEKKIFLDMKLVPFGKISRNGILYNKEATIACLQSLVGRPFLDNHSDETPNRESAPLGHFVKAWNDESLNMAMGTVDLDPKEEMIIHKIQRKDLTHCSIQVLAGRAVDREINGQNYAEAYPDEFLEASLVKIEGFASATLGTMIAEAFHQEDVNQQKVDQYDAAAMRGQRGLVQVVGGNAQGVKCTQCGSDKVAVAPNVENGFSCNNCNNQFTGQPAAKAEDVSTGNAGGLTATTLPAKKPEEAAEPQSTPSPAPVVEPFDLQKFIKLVGEDEAAARDYALQFANVVA